MDLWVTGRGEAVLQLQHREDLGAGSGAERAVQLQSDRAVWMEPGLLGRYRVAAEGQRWWGWRMTSRADQGEAVPVRKEWGGELPGGRKGTGTVRAHFTGATFAPAPTTHGHRGQEMVYTFREQMTLKAAEAFKMALGYGAVRMANRTYRMRPHGGDTWHYAFLQDDGMESISPLPECERQGNDVSVLAKVAGEWVPEAGGAEPGGETGTESTVGAIRRARYRRGEWMTRENTKMLFPVATKGPAAAQWRAQAVHMLLPDDGLGDRGTVELEVCHRQGPGTSTMYRCLTSWSQRRGRKAWKSALGSVRRGRRCRYTPWGTGMGSQTSSGSWRPRGVKHYTHRFSECHEGQRMRTPRS